MVIVRLKGGLGNQLFQYAFARALAEYRNERLIFDLSYIRDNPLHFTPRAFKLSRLNNYTILDQDSVDAYNEYYRDGKTVYISDDFLKQVIGPTIDHPSVKAILLDGYFQDEFYFLPYVEVIKQELKDLLNHYYNQYLESYAVDPVVIDAHLDTVSVHLRRTDYLEPATLKAHGICEPAYYEEALQIIHSKLDSPKFYLFSDDPKLANLIFAQMIEKNLNVSDVLQQAPIDNKDLIELYLMTRCKNFIMANSSFSWWGSYLCEADPKITIAPKNWFLDPKLKQMSEDIVLNSWIRI